MKKNLAYIGLSYHSKTQSTKFLIDYLKEFYNVDVFIYDNPDENFDFDAINGKYDSVVLFQASMPINILKKIRCRNILYFPMYDQVKNWRFVNWWKFKNCKIVNFSKTVHDKLTKWGFNSIYLQYFTEPKEFSPGNKNEVFFWQRIEPVNFNVLKPLFDTIDNSSYKVHIHTASDPNHNFEELSSEDEKKFSITYSDWFDTRDEMQDVIKQKQIYIAPRVSEGIGMSFLEALSMGKAVVANNEPTMNEYIQHNVNGYLFDLDNPTPIDFSNVEQVQKNAWEFYKSGYEKWLKDKIQIIDFIESKPRKAKIGLLKEIFLLSKNVSIRDIIRFKSGKRAYFKLFGCELYRKNC